LELLSVAIEDIGVADLNFASTGLCLSCLELLDAAFESLDRSNELLHGRLLWLSVRHLDVFYYGLVAGVILL